MESFSNRYLNFYANKRKPYRGKSFLWPVWVWQMLAPEPSRNSLNIFQRSILGLIEARKDTPNEIARWLGLEPEMIHYIIAGQLQPNGWLDSRGKLTDRGKELLNDDLDARRNLTTCYVFQDALTGDLWPRVIHELPHVEADFLSKRGFPVFIHNRETGAKDEPFCLFCNTAAPQKPDSQNLRETIRQGNNIIHNQKIRGEYSDHWQQEIKVDEIEYIEDTPFPAYTFGWAIPDIDYGWSAADPIAITGTADWMRKSIYDQAKKSPAFAGRLRDFLGEQPEAESWQEHADRLDEEVKFKVFAEFPGIQKLPGLSLYMGALLRREQRLSETEKGKERFEDCDDLVTQAQKVLEVCFKWMLEHWSIGNSKTIKKGWEPYEVRACLENIGRHFLTDQDLNSLATVQAGRLYSAARFRKQSLKPLVAATIITLPGHSDHPLFHFPIDQLAISEILALAEARNELAAHASGKTTKKAQALGFSEFTKNWVKILINSWK